MSNLWITPEELGDYAETEFSYEAAKAASNLMWALSGRKYSGITTVSERYVCAGRASRYGLSAQNTQAILVDGDVQNFYSDDANFYGDTMANGFSSLFRIRLRGRPVTKVHTVRDRVGTIMSPSNYYLVDHSTLQVTPGAAWTPCDIEITYSHGVEPPTLGKMAARTLAIEFAKLWTGDVCDLPQRVTSIARQGVSYTLLDSQEFVEDLRTGLYVVDMFLKSVNPDKARAKARVFSPDISRARRSSPKELRLAATELDIAVPAGSTGTINVALSAINASFFTDGSGWVPEIRISNYAQTATKALTGTAGVVSDPTTSASTVAYKELTDNMAILTTVAPHGMYPGVAITVAGVDGTFNGSFTVRNVPSTTKVQYNRTAANVVYTAGAGTVTSTANDSRIAVNVTYADALSILGMIDPGSWDLYAIRPHAGAASDVSYVCSGNLKIALASSAVNAYSAV